jgi:PPOX class probable F420-dependent enzyme
VGVPIEPRIRELLRGPNYAHVATTNADGSPQTSAVWIGEEGDVVTFYKEPGALAVRNLRRDPRVAVSMTDFDDPYLGCNLRGRVIDIEAEPGAERWLRERALEYHGRDLEDDERPPEGVLIHFEVERQSWHHFDSAPHSPPDRPPRA